MQTEASILIGRASHYIRTLCRHFAHRLPAEFSETQAKIQVPFGIYDRVARPEAFILRVQAKGSRDFDRMQDVIGEHLEEFAYRSATIEVQCEAVP